MIMYVILGMPGDGQSVPERGRVFVTEDDAYAALGRLVAARGELGDLQIRPVDVVGQLSRDAIEAPDWLTRLHSNATRFGQGAWATGVGDRGPGTVLVRDSDGDWRLILAVTGGATSDQDAEAARWLARVIARELGA